jgi:hypothetical protein
LDSHWMRHVSRAKISSFRQRLKTVLKCQIKSS